MSTYFSNLTNQRDALPTQYLLNSKLSSYQSSELPDNVMYLITPSTAVSHPQLFSGTSFSEGQSIEGRAEMLFAPPGNPVITQPIDSQLSIASNFSDDNVGVLDPQVYSKQLLPLQSTDQNFHHQGLSLSLGNQVPHSVQIPSYQNPYTNSGISPLLNSHSHIEHSIVDGSHSNEMKKAEYFSFDLTGPTDHSFKDGSVYNSQPSLNSKAVNSDMKLQEETAVGGMIYNPKYLEVAQELLDEVVNLQDLKQLGKRHDIQSFGNGVSEEVKLKSEGQSWMPSDPQKSMAISDNELSPAERNELQNKMTKLFSLLDEVDRRYKQYYQQMQAVVSSFEIMAGPGAARRYSALALQTISCQFRCLRDAIKKQIEVVQLSLGEQCSIPNSQGLSRLRYIDQQVRQQRTLQQFGMMRQPWRPQRGLPENAVSVLRAWLFEHFLHPYPKDSEKIMLARQTGLTRSQVANWFINARVRLWKPMIEKMYKEEFGEMESYSKSSPEIAEAAGRLKSESQDTDEELAADGGQTGQSNERTTNMSSDLVANASTDKISMQNDPLEEGKMGSDLNKSWRNEIYQSNHNNNDQGITSAPNAYKFSFLGGKIGSQVSLALGLQHSEKDPGPISGGTQSGMDDTAASVGLDKAEFYCMDPINQQDRFSNSHLLSDFVVRGNEFEQFCQFDSDQLQGKLHHS